MNKDFTKTEYLPLGMGKINFLALGWVLVFDLAQIGSWVNNKIWLASSQGGQKQFSDG